jgi:GDPmannose 4,6-dehydratase
MAKRALICGVSGQDGAYLGRHLLAKGYHVIGTSRDAQMAVFSNLKALGIAGEIELCSMAQTDFRSTLQTLTRAKPDEVYNLAGQSSVGLSFEQPVETMESVHLGVLNLLEAIRFLARDIRLYQASSSESFGDTRGVPAQEDTPFRPRSPYAVAKAAAHWSVVNYREAYGLQASNGILFNHESPLRPRRFVTRKIISAAVSISRGQLEQLKLGNLDICRDWGSAEEYVDAMWRILQHPVSSDFVIATGKTYRLQDFVASAFAEVGLNWQDHVHADDTLRRPSDVAWSGGNPGRAHDCLGWRATSGMHEVIRTMIAAELSSFPGLA